MKKTILSALTTFIFVGTMFAQLPGWNLDRSHSSITFNVQHMVISEVTGRFREFSVNVVSSKEDFSDAVIDATIAVNSIDTENERRDGHLKTDDFFNAEKFPTIKFQSTSFEKVNIHSYKIHGELTIRDTTKEVAIDAVHNGTLVTSRGTRSGWKATLAINRFDYGLKWNRTVETGGLVAGEVVNITFNLEFVKQ